MKQFTPKKKKPPKYIGRICDHKIFPTQEKKLKQHFFFHAIQQKVH
jgi:hypothetical protein